MLSWSFVTLLAVAPPTGFTVSMERFAVDRVASGATVVTDPLMGQVVLKGITFSGRAPRLCPTVERKGPLITLRCTSRRLWAELSQDEHGAFVDLRELTGVSWLDQPTLVPMKAWSLHSVLLPDTCPGTLAAARGECALARGELEVARAAWTEGLQGPDVSLCHLRLGDLAVHDADIETALAHYGKVPPVGPIGHMGLVRSCELMGTCLKEAASDEAASTDLLARDMSRELRLLTVRRELAAGRDARAMQTLQTALDQDPDACEGSLSLCQKLIAVGLQSDDTDARVAALASFLTDRARKGPAEYELNSAASQAARDLGAPAFAASILSANTPKVPASALAPHLLEIIRLYLAARDPVRAAVVLEYAEGKLGAVTQGEPWASARRQLHRRARPAVAAPSAQASAEALEALSTQVSLSTDLARAASLRSRAGDSLPQNRSNTENAP